MPELTHDKGEKLSALRFDAIVADDQKSSLRKYQDLVVGERSIWELAKYETLTCLMGSLPGGVGIFLRGMFYRGLFRSLGKGVVIGSNVTIRHPSRISIGAKAVLDDYSVLSARGSDLAAINIGKKVLIGRGAHIRVREGILNIGDASHVGPLTFVGTTQNIHIGEHVLIAAGCYIGGANKNVEDLLSPIAVQGMEEKGGVIIEDDVFIGVRVVVNDGVKIGRGSVIGAGAVVTRDIPSYSIAHGVPARIVNQRAEARDPDGLTRCNRQDSADRGDPFHH